MKTYEEAVRGRLIRTKEELEQVPEFWGKCEDLAKEIGGSQLTRQVCESLMCGMQPMEGQSEDDYYLSVVMSAYLNGVLIGIEMEKSEWPVSTAKTSES